MPSLPEDPQLIVPGERVGMLRIGDDKGRFWELFPKKSGTDQEYKYPWPGCNEDLYWLDLESHGGVDARLKDERIVQIECTSHRFHTADGITALSSPAQVRHDRPGLRAYWLDYPAPYNLGSRELIYWVDWKEGVAFSFAYARHLHRRFLYAIIVFKPPDGLCPDGNGRNDENWRELPPYTLELPKYTKHRDARVAGAR